MRAKILAIENNIAKVMVGCGEVTRLTMTALITGGHVLLEDLPGTGKTTLALLHVSQSLAFLEGRSYVVPEDITRLGVCVCAHRLVLTRHIGRTAGQKQ